MLILTSFLVEYQKLQKKISLEKNLPTDSQTNQEPVAPRTVQAEPEITLSVASTDSTQPQTEHKGAVCYLISQQLD